MEDIISLWTLFISIFWYLTHDRSFRNTLGRLKKMHSFFNLEIDHMFNLTFNGDLMFNFVYLLFFLIFGGYMYTWGFPCDSKSKKKKKLQCRRSGFHDPWVWKIPWSREWQHTQVFLPGKFHGQRSLVGYSPWGRKESDMTERLTHTYVYL